MKKMVVVIVSCMIFLVTSISISEKIKTEKEDVDISNLKDILDGSWMEDKGDFKILFLNGSNYNMGYQYGYYLKTEIEENGRVRYWIYVGEIGKYLRIVTLPDKKTIHNAFPDRGFKER